MKRTNIYLDDEQLRSLDAASQAADVSKAELVRQLIDVGLGRRPAADAEADIDAIAESFGALADADAPPLGVQDGRAQHLEKLFNA